MINVLKAELFRLKKSKTYWIIHIVNVGLIFLSALLLIGVESFIKSVGSSLFDKIDSYYTTTMLAEFATFASDSSILAVICSAIFLSREFTQGTMRNAILANKSRKELFFAYYIIALLIGVSYLLVAFVLQLALYGAMLGFGTESAASAATNIFTYFALGLCSVLFAQTCVTMFLFVTRRQSLTIILPLLICMLAPAIITSIIELILTANAITGSATPSTTLQCIPIYNMTTLNPNNPSGLNVGMIALYDVVMAAGLFAAGFFPFQKADLK